LLRGRLIEGWSRISWRNACHDSDKVFEASWFFDVGLRSLESADLSARGKSAVCVSVSAGSILLATAKEQTKGASINKRNARAGEKPEQVWGFIATKPRLIYK
jgi:hypothetical protein